MDGDWNLKGCSLDDPARLRSLNDLEELVHETGFLPLFSGDIPGFSVEERVWPFDWWSDDPEKDPWIWRMLLAEKEEIAYGKFFDRKAGFISKKWFPVFANYRRDGYDYEGLYEDGRLNGRAKRILDALELNDDGIGMELMSGQIRKKSEVEKGFDGAMIDLQMQSFLLISRFRQKRNKYGIEYGWHLPSFMTPETKWGYDFVNSQEEKPEESGQRLYQQIRRICPAADEKALKKLLK